MSEGGARNIQRRDILRLGATAGGVGAAAFLLGDITGARSAVNTNTSASPGGFSEVQGPSAIAFPDSSGNHHVKDGSNGQPIVNANVVTAYGASIGAGAAGASSTTGGIQEAVNSLPETGGMVFVKVGTYRLSSTISLPEGVALVGESQGWRELQNGAALIADGNFAAISVIQADSPLKSYFSRIENLLIIGSDSAANTNNHGVQFTDDNVHDAYVRNVSITTCYDGLHVTGNSLKLRCRDLTLEGNTHDGAYAMANITLDNCYIRANGGYGAYIGVAGYVAVHHCQFILNALGGVYLSLFQENYALGYDIIDHNLFDSNAGAAHLTVLGQAASPLVMGNTFWAEDSGSVPTNSISIQSWGGGLYAGNEFDPAGQSGAVVALDPTVSEPLFASNKGFSFGVLSNPFGGALATPFNDAYQSGTVGANGDQANFTSSKTYRVNVAVDVTVVGGSGVSITTKDMAGNTIDEGVSALTHRVLNTGYTIVCTYATAPTTTVVQATVGLCGTQAAPEANVNYVAKGGAVYLTSSGGTGVSITSKDGTTNKGGNVMDSGLTDLTRYALNVNQVINFGALTKAPALVVVL